MNTAAAFNFKRLSDEFIKDVIDNLSVNDILSLCSVNKSFNERGCLTNDSWIWQYLFHTRLSDIEEPIDEDYKTPFLRIPEFLGNRLSYAKKYRYELLEQDTLEELKSINGKGKRIR